MANEPTWINFGATDLPTEQHELFIKLIEAKRAFEASFPARDGFTLRFSYKGGEWDRLGFCEVARPRDKTSVAANLSAWLATQRAANAKH